MCCPVCKGRGRKLSLEFFFSWGSSSRDTVVAEQQQHSFPSSSFLPTQFSKFNVALDSVLSVCLSSWLIVWLVENVAKKKKRKFYKHFLYFPWDAKRIMEKIYISWTSGCAVRERERERVLNLYEFLCRAWLPETRLTWIWCTPEVELEGKRFLQTMLQNRSPLSNIDTICVLARARGTVPFGVAIILWFNNNSDLYSNIIYLSTEGDCCKLR